MKKQNKKGFTLRLDACLIEAIQTLSIKKSYEQNKRIPPSELVRECMERICKENGIEVKEGEKQ